VTSEELLARVEAALADLAASGRPITFTAVAAHAGLARPTLYRDATLHAMVEEHRVRDREARTLSGLRAEIGHLRTALEEVAVRVHGHEERLRRIEGRSARKSL
jgi:hypothetical protein